MHRGTRGEFICHMASDVSKLLETKPSSILLPDDFEQHVHPEPLSTQIFFDGQVQSMLNVSEDSVNSVIDEQENSSFTSVTTILESQHPSFTSVTTILESQQSPSACEKSGPVTEELSCDPRAKPDEHEAACSPSSTPEDREVFQKLPSGKLRQLMHDTERRIKEFEDVLKASPLRDYDRKYVLWEVFAGEGRVSKTAARRQNMQSERFSLSDGWDFAQASCKILQPEEHCLLLESLSTCDEELPNLDGQGSCAAVAHTQQHEVQPGIVGFLFFRTGSKLSNSSDSSATALLSSLGSAALGSPTKRSAP